MSTYPSGGSAFSSTVTTPGAVDAGTATDTIAGRIAGSEFVFANRGAGTQTVIGAVGPGASSGITFQNAEVGSNLYRSGAGQIKTDGQLVVVGTAFLANGGFNIAPGTYAGGSAVGGTFSYGTGAPNNANGTNGDFYFRVDGGALTTIYQRRAGLWTGIV